ncbi:hypothetical protein BDZ91DRAFT_761553 [Kalaharituber pfeilii]|nr:hypothetical protein BDZ91DRAFT_761553 [Kalaharituber pfeilii]
MTRTQEDKMLGWEKKAHGGRKDCREMNNRHDGMGAAKMVWEWGGGGCHESPLAFDIQRLADAASGRSGGDGSEEREPCRHVLFISGRRPSCNRTMPNGQIRPIPPGYMAVVVCTCRLHVRGLAVCTLCCAAIRAYASLGTPYLAGTGEPVATPVATGTRGQAPARPEYGQPASPPSPPSQPSGGAREARRKGAPAARIL